MKDVRRSLPVVIVLLVGATIAKQAWAGNQVDLQSLIRMVVFALPIAGIYAISATGLVVVYSATGIFNLAQGAIGMFCAFVYWELHVNQGWPTAIALLVTVCIFAPLLGVALDRIIMRRLTRAPLVTQLVATVGLLIALLGLANARWDPNDAHGLIGLGGSGGIRIEGVLLSWHRVIVIAVAVGLAAGLRLLFRSRLGIAMRAVVDDDELAALHGVRPARISSVAWVIGSVCAALAGILIAPEVGNVAGETLTMLVFTSFAAAVVGRLKSLPMTYVGALGMGLVMSFSSSFLQFGGRWGTLTNSIPALLLFVVLLALPPAELRLGRVVRTFPMERVPSWRSAVTAGGVCVLGVALLAPMLSEVDVSRLTYGVTTGVILLSLVPLIGWAGLPFLAPYALAGFGAWFTWRFSTYMPGVLALLLAGAANAVIGVLAALPALRLRGLYLALSSIAFALVTTDVIFGMPELFATTRSLQRPSLFGLDLAAPDAYLIFSTVVFVLLALALVAIRRSRFGRRLVGCRDSEAAAACFGVSLAETKVLVFALAGAVAGIGGGLLAFGQRFASADQFPMIGGLTAILTLVVWGIGTVSGPLVAAATGAALATASHDWAPGTVTRALELVGPALAALALVALPRGQVPAVSAEARLDPNRVVVRLVGTAAGAAIGVLGSLPGLVGFFLAIVGNVLAGSVFMAARERRDERRGESITALEDPATTGLGIDAPFTTSARRRIDEELHLPALVDTPS